ncbi:sulfite exporter TauE/SafE family protein [Limnoglobus roseus]|uniref:Probable membrane transporter protein n=1 Tax=Limnoglobus roseus TaxID=2598579 RepID=A0A5C1A8Y4_9BACT|nr:sulfite exporter TauE/SafE family protein [Limnoglobus roseus]QEL13568.1 hypothetical protein PX52LOC_00426 [Limnoglobus roseus]
MSPEELLLVALIFVVAALYSSVGHAGASGYLAVMTFFNLQQSVAKPTALTLNIFVASITVFQFARAGHFSWRILWPFLVGSMPFAFFGGAVKLPDYGYRLVVALVLLVAAVRLMIRGTPVKGDTKPPAIPVAIVTGAGVGLLAGLTGTGGGVFLTPLLLFFRWADTKAAAGVSAAFILGNSLTGLAGNYSNGNGLPEVNPVWVAVAGVGGLIGSYFGARKFETGVLRKLLGVALLVAVVKLIQQTMESFGK